jgi:ergothioneine biosynthesis protein EgtB
MRNLLHSYRSLRQRSLVLIQPLSDEDCCVQSMSDASPIKWHLAHTTWFFETFILERYERKFQAWHPDFRMLFNSYYNGIGDKFPRPQRGLLTRPSLGEVLRYRRNVDERIGALLETAETDSELAALIETGVHHEQQHQELMLTDVKHLLSMNPLKPAYSNEAFPGNEHPPAAGWMDFDAGLVNIGHSGEGFFFDNEAPRHRQFVESFALATALVRNGEYLEFIEDGGYANPVMWLSEGWDWVQANRLTQPMYWQRDETGWQEFTLHGMQALDRYRPVTHVSFFEADAYARWRNARLPTEAEWEHAAAGTEDFGVSKLHPALDASTENGFSQLFGAVWQWTFSSYAPYPGYQAPVGALGEYNGKFMSNQYVLRGSSCATPDGHARISYRNFFPSSARWQFSGIRLAKSLSRGYSA